MSHAQPWLRLRLPSVHSPAYRYFLRQLRTARTEARLTQAQVAHALKKPQSYVSKCESGERRVDVTELAAFARLYRKQLDFFVPLATSDRA